MPQPKPQFLSTGTTIDGVSNSPFSRQPNPPSMVTSQVSPIPNATSNSYQNGVSPSPYQGGASNPYQSGVSSNSYSQNPTVNLFAGGAKPPVNPFANRR